ncbi:MAG: hypothetical protein KDK54_17290 [Leptospiraceae bacterium]|nr:hypothetical protein [Leptospiraceae bacterium]
MKSIFSLALLLVLINPSLRSDDFRKSTFMGNSLIHMPSTEDIGKGNLDFRFNHRFSNAKSGFSDFFGLDGGANTQLSLDYGITDRLSVGIARTSFFKTYEGRSKFRLISDGDFHIPFNISLFGVLGQETSVQNYTYGPYVSPPSTGLPVLDSQIKTALNSYELNDGDKRSYMGSILISKRFNDVFSLQLSPIFVHRNFVKSNLSNDRTGLDISGRIKLSKRVDFTFSGILTPKRDYIGTDYATEDRKSDYNLTNFTATQINTQYNKPSDLSLIYLRNVILDKPVSYYSIPLSFGIDLETGGHVFQFFITNMRTIAQSQLLRGADYNYNKRDWSIGFNIHRTFTLIEDEELK